MRKQVTLTRESQIEEFKDTLRASAEETQLRIAELAGESDPMDFLFRLKFERLGCDPLNSSRELNFVEQLNQTFTYLASFSAAEFLFERHPTIETLKLNLGTDSGWDLETTDDGGIAAEVFAAVTPRNNRKLAEDIKKVAAAATRHRYVLFVCPSHEAGPYKCRTAPGGVTVWSLGLDL